MESGTWYRIAGFHPKLRRHARIYRHHYRGRLTYVLQDRTSGRYHMCSPTAYYMVSLMDGSRSVSEMWDMSCKAFPDENLTQADVTKLLSMLYSSDVLHGDTPSDITEITERGHKQSKRKTLMRFLNPLALRIPLLDPDNFLRATMPGIRFIFSPWTALIYLCIISYAAVQTGVHWDELTNNIADRVFAAENILIMLLVYPLVKAVHELGHGYVVKYWGGEVHEIGVMFLVFMPVPYVDASAATAFPVKWQRALVGAAGILVELLVAALALFIWLAAEDGLVKSSAYSVMLIGGVSTLFFNGNPLLRFDGYYVLQDILEIPNLGTRSTRYIAYLIKSKLLGLSNTESPATSKGEARRLLIYGISSFIYRIFIMVAIVMFVATQFFFIGVVLACWSALLMLGLPLAKQLNFLLRSPTLRGKRPRALLAVSGALSLVVLFILVIPLPYNTVAQGIVWMPGEATIHARSQGIVETLLAEPLKPIDKGAALLELSDPFLDMEVAVNRARVHELSLRQAEQNVRDRVNARIVEEQLRQASADLALSEEYQRNLRVTAETTGSLILPRAADLPGKFVQRGDILGYIADYETPIVRMVLDEDAIEQVRSNTRYVEMRLIERSSPAVSATILREIPSLSDTLPSMALSTQGGGLFMLDPTNPEQNKVLNRVFNLELKPAEAWPVSKLGMRVYIKFSHGWQPLGLRIYRATRRVFLRQLNV